MENTAAMTRTFGTSCTINVRSINYSNGHFDNKFIDARLIFACILVDSRYDCTRRCIEINSTYQRMCSFSNQCGPLQLLYLRFFNHTQLARRKKIVLGRRDLCNGAPFASTDNVGKSEDRRWKSNWTFQKGLYV